MMGTEYYFGGFRTQTAEQELKVRFHITRKWSLLSLCQFAILPQLWNSLLQLDCPEELVGEWHGIVKCIVTERVEGIVSALCVLADTDSRHR